MNAVIHSSVQRGPLRRVTEVSDVYPDRIVNVVHLSLECGHIETVCVTKGYRIKPRWISCETCGKKGPK